MLVHEHVNRSCDGQEDRYGTVRAAVMKMMNRHVIPFPFLKGTLGSLGGDGARCLTAAIKDVGRVLSPVRNHMALEV